MENVAKPFQMFANRLCLGWGIYRPHDVYVNSLVGLLARNGFFIVKDVNHGANLRMEREDGVYVELEWISEDFDIEVGPAGESTEEIVRLIFSRSLFLSEFQSAMYESRFWEEDKGVQIKVDLHRLDKKLRENGYVSDDVIDALKIDEGSLKLLCYKRTWEDRIYIAFESHAFEFPRDFSPGLMIDIKVLEFTQARGVINRLVE